MLLLQVAALFQDCQDLLVEFIHFLPDNFAAPSDTHIRNSAVEGFMGRDERSPAVPSMRLLHVIPTLVVLFHPVIWFLLISSIIYLLTEG